MTQSLTHRGPDNLGEYSDIVNSYYVYLGHCRLSIIDLSDRGNQPMISKNKHIVIVYNGEVYNFQKLKEQYLGDIHFRSDTDTEVILELYQRFGIDFINMLNGDFAFAVYDKKKRKIFLVRDRVGVKPFYFYFNDGCFVFGSEIKAILAFGVKPVLDEEFIQQYFVFKYVPRNDTLFKGIHRVPPAHYIEYDIVLAHLNIERYWQVNKNAKYSLISYQDAQKEIYRLVEDSIHIRLMSDVPVGTFLSGGIDSSIIASFLKRNKNIEHYCAEKSAEDTKKEGTTSDIFYAKLLTDEWELNLNPIPIGYDEASLELIRTTIKYSDDLIADGSQIPSYLITKEAKKRSTVILSGMGADELFLGYAGHMITLLSLYLEMMPSFLFNGLGKIFRKINAGKGSFKAHKRYLYKLGKYHSYPYYKYGLLNIVGDFENSTSILKQRPKECIEIFEQYFSETHDPYDDLFRFEIENFLVKNLHYTDRMSMANSVENRVPFLDHRIIELAYSLPREFKLSNFGAPKKILKGTFRNKLPSNILRRRKAGFGMPLRSIFSNETKINELLDRSLLNDLNLFSLVAIEKVIANHIAGREDNSSIIYALISFQEWYRMYIAK